MIKKMTLTLFAGFLAVWGQFKTTSYSNTGVEIQFTSPVSADQIQAHAKLDLTTMFSGADVITGPDGSALPCYRTVIGLPPEGNFKIEVVEGVSHIIPGIELTAYTTPGIGEDSRSIPRSGQEATVTESAVTESVRYTVTRWRDYWVVIINLVPVTPYDTSNSTVTLYKYSGDITIKVSFEPPTGLTSRKIINENLEKIYSSSIVNYEQCRDWTINLNPAPASTNPFSVSDNWIKVSVAEDGVYRIRFRDLKKLGINPGEIDPGTLRLLYPGYRDQDEDFADSLSELPVYVHGEADGSFNREDYVVFFARGADYWDFSSRNYVINPYVRENVYWLTWGGAPGRRLETRSAYPLSESEANVAQGIVHFEEEQQCPGRSGFLWVWNELTKSTSIVRDTFLLEYSGVAAVDTFSFKGYALDSGVGFRLLIGADTLYANTSASTGIGPPAYKIVEPLIPPRDELELVVEVFGDGQKTLYVDWVQMVVKRILSFKYAPYWVNCNGQATYLFTDLKSAPYIFDMSDPSNPVILTDWQLDRGKLTMSARVDSYIPLWVSEERKLLQPVLEISDPGALWDEDWGVDYIVLSTTENMDAAREFAAYRSEKLWLSDGVTPRAKAVLLADIVRDFGYGLAEPQAVRHFLSYAYHKGEGRPFYVLILGDGSYDFKNNLKLSGRPEYFLVHTRDYLLDPNVLGRAGFSDDGWFVDFDDDGSYNPEMTVGRITARNSAEAFVAIDKVKSYESQTRESWSTRLILLADDFYKESPSVEDEIKNHIDAVESLYIDHLYPEFDAHKVYLTDYEYEGGARPKPDAEAALLDALNQGGLLWFFFGHGKGDQLTHEKVFLNTDVPKVHNETRLPFVTFCSCGIGRFEDTKWECVAEELVRSDEGAIAALGATKGTSAGGNETFSNALASSFRELKNPNTGDLFFAVTPINQLYVFFGDPGVQMLFPTHEIPSFTVDTLVMGDTAQIEFRIPDGIDGWYASAYGSWERTISPGVYQETYYRKGEMLYRARGEIADTIQTLRFIVPEGINTGDSSYIHVICSGEDSSYTYMWDGIEVVTGSGLSADRSGPEAVFYANGIELFDGDSVPASFTLTAELSDPSGINLTGLEGIGTGGGHPFSLVINDENEIDLASYFEYQVEGDELASYGIATVDVDLTSTDNTLTLYAVDNYRNSSRYDLTLYTSFARRLEITDNLLYPNPVSSTADFTFELNAMSEVSIQIFTVSGRLVRTLPPVLYPAGFGTYTWDGLDAQGTPLPNGVYIYRLSALNMDTWLPQGERTAVNGKFIISR